MPIFVFIAIGLVITLVVIGVALRVIGSISGTGAAQATAQPTNDTQTNGTSGDEKKDPLLILGLTYNRENYAQAAVGWDETKGDIKKIITNIAGWKYDAKDDVMVPLARDEDQYAGETLLEHFARVYLSRRVVGLPFVTQLMSAMIDRVVKKPSAPGEPRTLAQELEASRVKRYGIKGTFPRDTNHVDFDTKDKRRFSVNTVALIRLKKPKLVFSTYKDNFMFLIDQQINSFLKNIISKQIYDDYAESSKREFSGTELDPLNLLLRPIGFECYLLTSSDPELNKEIQEALEEELRADEKAKGARKTAEGIRDAKIIEAEGTRQAKIIEAEGTKKARMTEAEGELYAAQKEGEGIAYQLEVLSKAYGGQIKSLYNAIKGKNRGVSNAEALHMAHEQILKRVEAEGIGKLTGVWAPGGNSGVQVTVPAGGAKEKPTEPETGGKK
jgi:regulator of protease activity HflC (stomatin/prohibitin superfamily)